MASLSDNHDLQLETALASERRVKTWKGNITQDSEDEPSDNFTAHRRTSKAARLASKSAPKNRKRSGTASSTQTHTDGNVSSATYPRTLLIVPSEAGSATPTHGSFSDVSRDDQSTPEPYNMPDISSDSSGKGHSLSTLSVPTPATSAAAADDSDTDFQSAYSTSPRASYVEDEDEDEDSAFTHENDLPDDFGTGPTPSFSKTRRERVSSTATAINTREYNNAPMDTLTSHIPSQ